MQKHYDYLLVGAGLFNAVFAHAAARAGKRCLVLEKRAHIGATFTATPWRAYKCTATARISSTHRTPRSGIL